MNNKNFNSCNLFQSSFGEEKNEHFIEFMINQEEKIDTPPLINDEY